MMPNLIFQNMSKIAKLVDRIRAGVLEGFYPEPQDELYDAFTEALKFVEKYKFSIAMDYAHDFLESQEQARQSEFDAKIDTILQERGIVFDPDNHAAYFKEFELEARRHEVKPASDKAVKDKSFVQSRDEIEPE